MLTFVLLLLAAVGVTFVVSWFAVDVDRCLGRLGRAVARRLTTRGKDR